MNQSDKSKPTVVKSESGRKNTPTKRSKTTKSPGNTLNSTVSPFTSSNHNAVLNNVGKPKKKTRKRRKKNAAGNVAKKRQKSKTEPRKTVTDSNLMPTSSDSTNVVTDQTIQRFNAPRKSDNTTVKSNFGGSHVMSSDKEVSNNILGAYQGEAEEEVHDENVNVKSSISKVNVHWEHFALLVEEYLLAIDVKM